jgi:hypothetical protein
MRSYGVVLAAAWLVGLTGATFGTFLPDPMPRHRSCSLVGVIDPPLELTLSLPRRIEMLAPRCQVRATFERHSFEPSELAKSSITETIENRVANLTDCFGHMHRQDPPIVWLIVAAPAVFNAGINGAGITTQQRRCVEETIKSWRFEDAGAGVSVAFPMPDCVGDLP